MMPPDHHPWNILDVTRWTTRFFASHEVENPRLSAELLLAHALGIDRIDLYLGHDRPLESGELSVFRALIKRRLNREPVAYIIGEKQFWTLSFEVDRRVLIPRPDTECLVENALSVLVAEAAAGTSGQTVWEAGTGSGAVIISLAAEVADGRFFASDISPAALKVAGRNAVRNGLPDRIGFFLSDWFSGVRRGGCRMDMIVINPPYIATREIEGLAPEIKHHEPLQALDGGPDGLDHIRHIIQSAADFLKPGGRLMLEIGWDQRAAVAALATATGRYAEIDFIRDLAGHDRVARLRT